jgi:hypothetical protein
MKRCYIGIISLLLLSLFLPVITFAHRSGCHRWHSCPSDTGSYICGDLGYPCQYPTYPKAGGLIYPLSPTPTPPSIQTLIVSKIEAAKPSYYKNPHGFRENLIRKINAEYGTSNLYNEGHNEWLYMIAALVYSLLPDVK